MDKHQELMDNAYDKWNSEWKGISYDEFIDKLDTKHSMAVLFGNLNYQVNNGGWVQWVQNGYCTEYAKLVEYLRILNTDTAHKAIKMLDKVSKVLLEDVVNGTAKSNGCVGTYMLDEYEKGTSEECYSCGGTGMNSSYDPDDEDSYEEEHCCECDGEGVVHNEPIEVDFDDIDTQFWNISEKFLEDCDKYFQSLK